MAAPPLCVLGARTGSSLATRVITLLGADPGTESQLMEGKPDDNPKGFWEQQPLVDLNDELLAKLGGPWWDMPSLPLGWHRDPELDSLRDRARSLVHELFPDGRQWVWKDPRASLTLPFWQDVIGPMRYVVCTRSPLEVAASLNARDPVVYPWRESTRVYFRLLREGLRHTSAADRIVVFYEDWFEDFDAQLERLALFATGSPPSDSAREDARGFFESELRHHEAAEHKGELDPEIQEGYALLRAGTDESGRLDPGAERAIDSCWLALEERVADHMSDLRQRSRAGWLLAQARQGHLADATRAFENVSRAHAEALARVESLEAEVADLRLALRERESQLAQLHDWLGGMEGSLSWKLTAPLRAGKRLFTRP